jgi:hypothetical protein
VTHLAARELRKIEDGRFFRKVDDWLGLMPADFERDDPTYLKILERYGPRESDIPHPADHFAHALGAIQLEMQKDKDADVIPTKLLVGEFFYRTTLDKPEIGGCPRSEWNRRRSSTAVSRTRNAAPLVRVSLQNNPAELRQRSYRIAFHKSPTGNSLISKKVFTVGVTRSRICVLCP